MEKKIAWLTLEREFLIEGNFGEEVCNFEEGSVAAEIFFVLHQRGNFLGQRGNVWHGFLNL